MKVTCSVQSSSANKLKTLAFFLFSSKKSFSIWNLAQHYRCQFFKPLDTFCKPQKSTWQPNVSDESVVGLIQSKTSFRHLARFLSADGCCYFRDMLIKFELPQIFAKQPKIINGKHIFKFYLLAYVWIWITLFPFAFRFLLKQLQVVLKTQVNETQEMTE